MTTDLSGVNLKLGRAEFHLSSLRQEMESVYSRGQIHFEHATRDDGRIHQYVVQGLPKIPPEWGNIIGDCLHNARSALDHLAHEIVKSLGGTPKYGPRGTSFPIMTRGSSPATLAGLVPLPPEIIAALEAVQPRNQGSGFYGTFMGALSELDNRDKHRRLLVVQYAANELEIAWGGQLDTPAPQVKVVEEGFSNGDEIVTLTYPTPVLNFDPSPRLPIRPLVEPDLPLWVNRERMSVDKFLGQVIEITKRVAEKFKPLLP
jgi:hypothetical protein